MKNTFTQFIFCIFFLLQIAPAFSSNETVLEKRFEKSTGKTKIQLGLQLTELFQGTDPKSMLNYALETEQLAKAGKHTLLSAKSNHAIGVAYILLGDYKKALAHFFEAKDLFEIVLQHRKKQADLNEYARTIGTIGVVFSEQNNNSKALEFYLKAIQIYRKIGNIENTGRLYNNIGIVYQAQEKNELALLYFLKCLAIQEQTKDETIGITLTNIGKIYFKSNQFKLANQYYNKALTQFKKYQNNRGLGELYNNLGNYYLKINIPEKAKSYYLSAIQTFQQTEDKFGLSDTYFFLGEWAAHQKQKQLALSYYEQSKSLSLSLGVPEQVKRCEFALYHLYKQTKQFELALDHYLKYSHLKDSILNLENVKQLIRAEMNFEYDKKDLKKQQLNERRKLTYEANLKRNQLIFFFAIVILLITFGGIFLIHKRKQINRTLKLKLDLVEFEQKALHLQMNPHFVFNCLGSISSFILQNNPDEANNYLSKFSKLMRLTLEFSKEPFIPIHKEVESLENYLALEKLRFNGVFTYRIAVDEAIEDALALPSMLIQPFVENAIIHGVVPKKSAGEITIRFSIDETHLLCEITDNGIGIEQSQKNKKGLVNVHQSMALSITKNRLKMMDEVNAVRTSLSITELKNSDNEVLGTQVILAIPQHYID